MNSLDKLEKSRGVVLFAFNTDKVDYVKIADESSRLIAKNLKLPITLITDEGAVPVFCYDRVIKVKSKDGNYRLDKDNSLIEWKNFDRYSAFYLSPYEETLLIDTDYLVLDDTLLKLFDQLYDYRLMYKMQTPAGISDEEMGPSSLPLVWATVVLFKKTKKSKLFFDLIHRIQKNYSYYKNLYRMRDTSYRNDHAFSIANIILNGYALDEHSSIPWPMLTIKDDVHQIEIKDPFLIIRTNHQATVILPQNLHIMDKNYLTTNNFREFVNKVSDDTDK
jgi:hypothetical protein